MTNSMKLSLLSVASVSALVLSGCAAIFAFPQPAGRCGGSNVSISATPDNPRVLESPDDTEITITFNGDIDDVELLYSIGVYNETGLNAVDETYLADAPRPDAPNESFMQFAYSGAPEFITLDKEAFEEVSPGRHQFTGTMLEILLDDDDSVGEIYGEAVLGILLAPGAFLVGCAAAGADENGQYVAAQAMFPNFVVLDPDDFPSLSLLDGEVVDFTLPEDYEGLNIYMLSQVRDPADEPLSEVPATDRWLQAFTINDEDFESGNVVEAQGVIGPGGSLSEVEYIGDGRFREGNTYNLILMFYVYGEGVTYFQTAIFDAAIDESGTTSFTPFEGEFISLAPTRGGGGPRIPSLAETRSVIEVSTRGYRELRFEGSALHKVSSASVGSKVAKLVESRDAALTLRLPKQAQGTYDLSLKHQRGTLLKQGFVKYVDSSKLVQFSLAKPVRKSAWLPKLNSALNQHGDTTQVDCVARVPSGSSAKALKKKASAVCASVGDTTIKTRVLVKKTPAGSTPSVAIKLWD